MIKILHNFALFGFKNANFFANFFGENILKIITSTPERFQNRLHYKSYTQNKIGVDVTIVFDFRKYSAKKMKFFLKNNVIIKILQKLGCINLNKKTTFFAIFCGNIKNHKSCPCFFLCRFLRTYVGTYVCAVSYICRYLCMCCIVHM
jgi:hypothetical protein